MIVLVLIAVALLSIITIKWYNRRGKKSSRECIDKELRDVCPHGKTKCCKDCWLIYLCNESCHKMDDCDV